MNCFHLLIFFNKKIIIEATPGMSTLIEHGKDQKSVSGDQCLKCIGGPLFAYDHLVKPVRRFYTVRTPVSIHDHPIHLPFRRFCNQTNQIRGYR